MLHIFSQLLEHNVLPHRCVPCIVNIFFLYYFNILFSVVKYNMTVFTGNVKGADADMEAEVYIILFGERGDTGKRILSRLRSDQAIKFQEGQVCG